MGSYGGLPDRRWQILAVLCFSVLLAVMDKTIVGSLAGTAMIAATLVWQLRRLDSRLDVPLVRLFSFTFLVTQYFQVVPGYEQLRPASPRSRSLL